jgi:hydroxyacylglutathione hydrolase
MKIRHFNALSDNYMYLITDDKTKECAVVDPAEPNEVRKTIFSKTSNYSF